MNRKFKELNGKDNLAISYDEGKILHDLIKKNRPYIIVEVGTGHGYSTIWMAHALRKNGTIYTIDERDLPHLFFCQSNVVFLLGTLEKFIQTFEGKIDFAFLDSQHTIDKIVKDIEMIEPFLSRSGIIVVHDTQYCEEMGKCLDDYFNGRVSERLEKTGVKPSSKDWIYTEKKTKFGLGIAVKGK